MYSDETNVGNKNIIPVMNTIKLIENVATISFGKKIRIFLDKSLSIN